jgi:hypothetical protein
MRICTYIPAPHVAQPKDRYPHIAAEAFRQLASDFAKRCIGRALGAEPPSGDRDSGKETYGTNVAVSQSCSTLNIGGARSELPRGKNRNTINAILY